MKTEITIDTLKTMNDQDIIAHIKKYPYPSMWQYSASLTWINYHLSIMTGNRYAQTGDKSVFGKPIH